jgi:hypothetical protein
MVSGREKILFHWDSMLELYHPWLLLYLFSFVVPFTPLSLSHFLSDVYAKTITFYPQPVLKLC